GIDRSFWRRGSPKRCSATTERFVTYWIAGEGFPSRSAQKARFRTSRYGRKIARSRRPSADVLPRKPTCPQRAVKKTKIKLKKEAGFPSPSISCCIDSF